MGSVEGVHERVIDDDQRPAGRLCRESHNVQDIDEFDSGVRRCLDPNSFRALAERGEDLLVARTFEIDKYRDETLCSTSDVVEVPRCPAIDAVHRHGV